MPIPFRAELEAFLAEFVAQHRGVRLWRMFGLPAAYVGRRLFVCAIEDGIIVRLPEEIARREIGTRGEPYSRRGRTMGAWVMYRPRNAVDARRLAPVLEIAARHIAERQVGDVRRKRAR